MDPNTALDAILQGHNVSDHAMALGQWLAAQGFAPYERPIPSECSALVAEHCKRHYPRVAYAEIMVRATRQGLWTRAPGTQWLSLALWIDLLRTDG